MSPSPAARDIWRLIERAARQSDPRGRVLSEAVCDRRFRDAFLGTPPELFTQRGGSEDWLAKFRQGQGNAMFFHMPPLRRVLNAPEDIAHVLWTARLRPGQAVLMVAVRGGYWEHIILRLIGRKGRLKVLEDLPEALRRSQDNLENAAPMNTVRFIPGDFERGPFPAGPWDRVIITGALEFIPPALTASLDETGILIGALRKQGVEHLVTVEGRQGGVVLGERTFLQRLRRDEEASVYLRVEVAGSGRGRRRIAASARREGGALMRFEDARVDRFALDSWRKSLGDLHKGRGVPTGKEWNARQALRPLGKVLWETLFSAGVREHLEGLARPILTNRPGQEPWPTRPNSPLIIETDAHDIPWELALLPERLDHGGSGKPVSRHLWEDFVVGRVPVVGGVVPRPLSARSGPLSALIAASSDAGCGGRFQAREVRRILETAGVACRVVSRVSELERALGAAERPFDIFHFCGHAAVDARESGRSALYLDEAVSASTLLQRFEGLGSELVFLNGCEAARGGRGGLGHLLGAFARSAGCIVGPLWPVSPEGAHEVAVRFYRNLVAGHFGGHALKDAKGLASKKRQDLTFAWAAYVYYGDPLRRVFPVA